MRIRFADGTPDSELLARFRVLAKEIYHDDPVWAPEAEDAIDAVAVRAASGEHILRMVVADSDHGPRARAVAMTSTDPRSSRGQIGLFECRADSPDDGRAVLEHCCRWLSDHRADRVTAPRLDQLRSGVQTGGFDLPHTVFTAHNPPHYVEVFRSVFSEETPMVSVLFTRQRVPRFPAPAERGLTVRSLDPANLVAEISRIEEFQRRVFAGRVGYVARSAENARNLAEQLLPVADPDLIWFALDEQERTVGVLIALPDAWQQQRPIDRARLVSIAVEPEWRGRKVALAMASRLAGTLVAKDYQSLEGSMILESNRRPLRLARTLGATRGRSFSLFQARL